MQYSSTIFNANIHKVYLGQLAAPEKYGRRLFDALSNTQLAVKAQKAITLLTELHLHTTTGWDIKP